LASRSRDDSADPHVLCGSPPVASRSATQQLGDHEEVVGENRGTHEEFEMLTTLDECPLHAAPPKEYRDAAFDASAESLASFERAALLVRFALRAPFPARLRDTRQDHARGAAGLQVLFVERSHGRNCTDGAPSRTPILWDSRDGLTWTWSAGFPSSTSYCVISPWPLSAKEHLVAEFHRREHLPPLDQIRVRLERSSRPSRRGAPARRATRGGLSD
jgi:hypothetical protein